MEKRSRYLFSEVNRSLYGNHWQRRTSALKWVLGIERHKNGNPHAHALLYAPGLDLRNPKIFSYREWKDFANWLGGYTWLEPVRAAADAVRYGTKYVLKDGDISLAPGFGRQDFHVLTEAVGGGEQSRGSAAAGTVLRCDSSTPSPRAKKPHTFMLTPERVLMIEQCRGRGAEELARRKALEINSVPR